MRVQPTSDLTTAVTFVAYYSPWSPAPPTAPGSVELGLLQKLLENGRFGLLTRGEHQTERLTLAFRSQMDFSAKSSLAATKGFNFSTTMGRSSRVLVGPNNGAVNIMDLPIQLASGVSVLLDKLKELVLKPLVTPPIKPDG